MSASEKFGARVASTADLPSDLDEQDLRVLDQVRAGTVAPDAEGAREWTRRLHRVIESGLVSPEARLSPEPPVLRPGRQALVDPELDEHLRVEGWVKVRVLSAEAAGELREAYGDVHGWTGEGFEPDPGNGDVEYRARSRQVLGAVLDPALAELFIDHRPFLQGYYLKWPDCPETHLHADWTNVDESSGHRSYIAWTALQDITDDVGQMSILPRSHTVDPSPRGSRLNLPLAGAWAGKEADIWRRLHRVPLRAGEALVFDMATIHASFSNTTDIPRVAAVTCLRPIEADLVYYRSVADGTVLRYEIDEEFFVEMTPADLVDELPDRVPNAVLEVRTPADAVQRADSVLASLEPGLEIPEAVRAGLIGQEVDEPAAHDAVDEQEAPAANGATDVVTAPPLGERTGRIAAPRRVAERIRSLAGRRSARR